MNDFGRPKSAHGPFGAHQHSRATAAAQVAMQSLEGSASRSVRNIRKAASVRAGRGNAARRAQRRAAAPRLCIKMRRRTAPATRLAWHTNIGRSHTPPKLPIRSTSTRSSAGTSTLPTVRATRKRGAVTLKTGTGSYPMRFGTTNAGNPCRESGRPARCSGQTLAAAARSRRPRRRSTRAMHRHGH